MKRRPTVLRASALLGALLASSLSGCVSLLPKQPPVQLYQFGRPTPAVETQTPAVVGRDQGALGVILAQVSFPRAATGDGLLTLRGQEAAYIGGARWLTPAVLMFQEDAEQAFAARARGVRLVARSELGAASALLRLDVGEFDARYDARFPGPPVVVVSLRATLARADGRALVQQGFTARRPASEDRASAIVAAYDLAVQDVLAQVVDWTDGRARSLVADTPTPSADAPLSLRAIPGPSRLSDRSPP